jgi:hypothetical protein
MLKVLVLLSAIVPQSPIITLRAIHWSKEFCGVTIADNNTLGYYINKAAIESGKLTFAEKLEFAKTIAVESVSAWYALSLEDQEKFCKAAKEPS